MHWMPCSIALRYIELDLIGMVCIALKMNSINTAFCFIALLSIGLDLS